MYEALNVLGAVPWQINRAVLSVVEQLYQDETGYKHLKIPAKESFDLPLPAQPLRGFRTSRTKGGGLSAGVRTGTCPSRYSHEYICKHKPYKCVTAATGCACPVYTTACTSHWSLSLGPLSVQFMKPPRRVLYLYNRESSAARKHNAESHSLRADLEWKLGVRLPL